jgi:hypothetical protein
MAWRKHLPIHGEDQDPQQRGESDAEYAARCMPGWGIVEMVAWNCRRFGGADVLLVEAKASGLDVIREMQRLYGHEKWGVVPIVPKTDKMARALSVQPAFAQHIVHAPDRDFARMVQDEMADLREHGPSPHPSPAPAGHAQWKCRRSREEPVCPTPSRSAGGAGCSCAWHRTAVN